MKQYKNITSKENPIYKLIKALSQKKVRESSRLFLIEGTRLLEEANNRGVKIKYLIINETAENVPKINQGCQVLRLPNNLFKKVSDTVSPQGIIAVAEQIEISLADITLGPNPLVVVLNSLQDPGNLGTIIRTSAAAGATAVLLTEGTVDLYNPKVIRSTMGSLFLKGISITLPHWHKNRGSVSRKTDYILLLAANFIRSFSQFAGQFNQLGVNHLPFVQNLFSILPY